MTVKGDVQPRGPQGGAKEAWWLATNLGNAVSQAVSYYDRRVGIKEQFRDAKGHRFGLKLRRTQFTRAEYVERMYLIVGVALLWTSVGRAVANGSPKVVSAQTKIKLTSQPKDVLSFHPKSAST